jgi:hypothetical protein
LVFASVYSEVARGYVRAINYQIEEEKMAVVIQELVGKATRSYYYPHVSGVAQSYNFYPFAHMQPEEGFALLRSAWANMWWKATKPTGFRPNIPPLISIHPKTSLRTRR